MLSQDEKRQLLKLAYDYQRALRNNDTDAINALLSDKADDFPLLRQFRYALSQAQYRENQRIAPEYDTNKVALHPALTCTLTGKQLVLPIKTTSPRSSAGGASAETVSSYLDLDALIDYWFDDNNHIGCDPATGTQLTGLEFDYSKFEAVCAFNLYHNNQHLNKLSEAKARELLLENQQISLGLFARQRQIEADEQYARSLADADQTPTPSGS